MVALQKNGLKIGLHAITIVKTIVKIGFNSDSLRSNNFDLACTRFFARLFEVFLNINFIF